METKKVAYFKSWFLYTILSLIAGFLAGALQGAILGIILGLAGVSLSTIPKVTGITGFLIAFPVSYYIFKWSVAKYIVPQIAGGLEVAETQEA